MNTKHKRHNPEKLKFFLYALIFLIIVAVVAVFINYRFFASKDDLLTMLKSKATVSLDKVEHTATKNGVKEWGLKAESVNYYQNKNEAIFKNINLVFFDKNKPSATLTAKKGHLNTETNDIVATGHVFVVHDKLTLETETLDFNNKKRIISSDVPVKLVREESQVTADSMHMDLNTNITTLKGNVKGTFIDDF